MSNLAIVLSGAGEAIEKDESAVDFGGRCFVPSLSR